MTSRALAISLAATLVLTGCMSWTPGWKPEAIASPVPPAAGEVKAEDAAGLLARADDAQSLARAVAAYQRLLAAAPADPAVLDDLAMTHVLYGAAYATGVQEKARWYRAGIRYAERAMATNPRFAARVAEGGSIADAVATLGRDEAEMRAMLFWVTGVSYYFKECLGVRTLLHFRWMLGTREVMEHMLALDPEFEHGSVLFSLGIYHLALPPGAGRDMKRSAEFLDRAIAASGSSLLPRWGRAKYFQTKAGNRQGFIEDLQWVISQDPHQASSPYAWNVYFQRDAKEMLARTDQLFPRRESATGAR